MAPRRTPPPLCPVCDEEVPRNALACPNCGSDWETGWNEDGDTSGRLGVDTEEFDYEEFSKREFEGKEQPRPKQTLIWVGFGLVVAAIIAALVLR